MAAQARIAVKATPAVAAASQFGVGLDFILQIRRAAARRIWPAFGSQSQLPQALALEALPQALFLTQPAHALAFQPTGQRGGLARTPPGGEASLAGQGELPAVPAPPQALGFAVLPGLYRVAEIELAIGPLLEGLARFPIRVVITVERHLPSQPFQNIRRLHHGALGAAPRLAVQGGAQRGADQQIVVD